MSGRECGWATGAEQFTEGDRSQARVAEKTGISRERGAKVEGEILLSEAWYPPRLRSTWAHHNPSIPGVRQKSPPERPTSAPHKQKIPFLRRITHKQEAGRPNALSNGSSRVREQGITA